MKVWSESFEEGAALPERLAFGKPNPSQHVELSDNLSPHLAWSDLPPGTRSLAVVCIDPDVPAVGDDVNREGVSVARDLPRVDFHHWGLVDLAPDAPPLAEGELSKGVTPRGKPADAGARSVRQAINDYTSWFAGDEAMAGSYFGYDGPCPPWNDERIHHYRFTVYALDVARCPVEAEFRVPDVLAAIEGHVLDQASVVGWYTLNPDAA